MYGNIPQLLQQLEAQQTQGSPQAQGVLSQLPPHLQQAATAPPPIPGGGDFQNLGGYAQQALGLAGIQPPPMPAPLSATPAQNAPPMPPPQNPFPENTLGKSSAFGGRPLQGVPGLLEHVR